MRKPHLWKAGRSNQTPSNILCFDSETYPTPVFTPTTGELHRLRLGWACGFRLEKGKRTRETWCEYRHANEFWDFLESRMDRHRPLWVFAHNLPFDLGTVKGWRYLSTAEWDWERIILTPSITYLVGVNGPYRTVWCDSTNYYHCPLATVGKAVGCPKMEMPGFSYPDRYWSDYCRNDVEILVRGMSSLITFVKEHRCGGWGPTIASLAMKSYLREFHKEKVLVHCHEQSLKLERAAYFGGMVSCPYIGRVPSTLATELDISSHYPACCLSSLPIRLIDCQENPSLGFVSSNINDYWSAADVTLNTQFPDYPVRHNGLVYYPVGTFRTQLADAEFRHAMEHGRIKQIHAISRHIKEPIFAEYMEYWYGLKEKYDRLGNDAFRTLCKYMLNSLYGKTGQTTPRWMAWGPEALRMVEKHHGASSGSLEWIERMVPDLTAFEETMTVEGFPYTLRLRDYFGEVEVCVGEHESRDSVPAIAAAVTSIGRVRLREVQEGAGAGNWFYSDTDSVWCSPDGVESLRQKGLVSSGSIGALEEKRVVNDLVVHGPKDYEFMGGRKLKGIRPSAEEVGEDVYRQLHFPSAITQLRDGLDEGVLVRSVEKHLNRTNTRFRLTQSGWTQPLMAGEDFPPKNA